MKVISDLGRNKSLFKNSYLAIGVFDGLHRGHQTLIAKAVQKAKVHHGMSVVMTFDPHPVHVLHPKIYCPLIVSLDHRLKLIEDLGVELCVVIPFTLQFSRLTPAQFVEKYLAGIIKPKEVFVGDDFRFGQNRSGDLDFFKAEARKFGFKVNVLHAVKGNHRPISSTRIRQMIAAGNFPEAAKLLGRPVSVFGKVIRGQARGKKLGFPTANILPRCGVLPPAGVYIVSVELGKENFSGIANFGVRPSFKSAGESPILEVHIFNFRRNIYGKEIEISFLKKIREEMKFHKVEDLIAQIKKDQAAARKFLQKHSP